MQAPVSGFARALAALAAKKEADAQPAVQAVAEAPVLARASGYVKKRYVDIGDRVKEGQILAELDAAETEQQVRQAKAAVEQANAAMEQAQALKHGPVSVTAAQARLLLMTAEALLMQLTMQ